jgi:hypothetical protein
MGLAGSPTRRGAAGGETLIVLNSSLFESTLPESRPPDSRPLKSSPHPSNAARTRAQIPQQSGLDAALRVEPLAALEWSSAIEPFGVDHRAKSPAEARLAWVHRAPEEQVLRLYRASRAADPSTEGPWWLRAITDGRLGSRAEAFAVEDRVSKMLLARPGWVFSPWGESGYWEYLPSEREQLNPTSLVFTARHNGWLDVFPAHDTTTPPAIAVRGTLGLRADLGAIEKFE